MWTPDDLPYWVAWSRPGDMRGAHLLGLFKRFGTLRDAWHAPEHELWGHVPQRFIEARRTCDPLEAWHKAQRPGMRILASPDPEFPKRLRKIKDPPALLYVRGHLPSFRRAVAVIGARAASPYGQRTAGHLARNLARSGALVVSGAAAGIDTAAHWGALEAGQTVAVLGCGLDHVYPAANRRLYHEIAKRGALITEYAPTERPAQHYFPQRNRLITGLSYGVVVVEAGLKSGTTGTVEIALAQHREIMAVPGPIDAASNMGTNALLRDTNAGIVTRVEDIFDRLKWKIQPVKPVTPEGAFERRVLDLLAGGPRPMDVLLGSHPPSNASLALLHLELEGLIVKLPGQRYALA